MTLLEKERYQRLKDQSKREHKHVLAAMRRFKSDGDALKWLASAESGADTRSIRVQSQGPFRAPVSIDRISWEDP